MSISALTPPDTREADTPARLRRGIHQVLRGPADQPAWSRPGLLALLATTAVLYLWGLGASGNANAFYAAAVQAGTHSWKAFYFGSVDWANFITVDKPPAALWVMALCGRLFGFNSWSMLVPQALEGVAAVGLLYATIRRWFGPGAGLIAGAVLALTPAAVLMFRYNNPDALLTLLLVVAAYTMTRALERGNLWWIVATGTALGFGFLTKMLQAFLILPALALVYLLAAPVGLWRRLGHLLAGAGAIIVSAGWWVATVELWPSSNRPYVGGSTNNSILELTFGYNGLGRIFGGEGNMSMGRGRGPAGGGLPSGIGGPGGGAEMPFGSGRPPGGGGFMGGATGPGRLFGESLGGHVAWLLPTALLILAVGAWLTLRAARTDRTRAGLVLWGGWLVVTAAVFSTMEGIFHQYYTVALAPAIGALVGIGCRLAWERRGGWAGRAWLAAMAVATGGWGTVLLWRTASWYPVLRYAVVALTAVAVVGLLAGGRSLARATTVGVVAALAAGTLGTGAYAVSTAAATHHGGGPTAGPSVGGAGGFGAGRSPDGSGIPGPQQAGDAPAPGGQASGGMNRRMLEDAAVDPALVSLLKNTTSTWAAATLTTSSAATLQLASDRPTMGIGGFTSSDPAPTLTQFQRYVADGKVRYFVGSGASGGGGMPGGAWGGPGVSSDSAVSEIIRWVQETFTVTTFGGQEVYDLSTPKR